MLFTWHVFPFPGVCDVTTLFWACMWEIGVQNTLTSNSSHDNCNNQNYTNNFSMIDAELVLKRLKLMVKMMDDKCSGSFEIQYQQILMYFIWTRMFQRSFLVMTHWYPLVRLLYATSCTSLTWMMIAQKMSSFHFTELSFTGLSECGGFHLQSVVNGQ